MQRLIRFAAIGIGALALTIGAQAQDGAYHGNQWENSPGVNAPYAHDASLINHVESDLARVGHHDNTGRHDQQRAEKARFNLTRFRANLDRGHFDRGRLDSAIDNMDHLVKSPRLDPREREVLSHDLYALRDFRANRGWAARYR
ncbi:MAG TPA: hypothetical protein VG675_03340 [Bryobacteraceae bacterium]|nr:hypothetical protein [Bryobacteraceae bacterium]